VNLDRVQHLPLNFCGTPEVHFFIPALLVSFLFTAQSPWQFFGHQLQNQRIVYHGISRRCFNFDWKNKSVPKDSATYQLLENPKLLSQNPKISASVIDGDNRPVYDRCLGFALTFPPQNILATFKQDGVTNDVPECRSHQVNGLRVYDHLSACYSYLRHHPEGKIKSSEELMSSLLPGSWNEVVVMGKGAAGAVKVAAIVIGCDKNVELSQLPENELRKALETCFETDKQNHLIDLIIARVREGYPLMAMNFSRFPEKD
jgi:hypothetical protein